MKRILDNVIKKGNSFVFRGFRKTFDCSSFWDSLDVEDEMEVFAMDGRGVEIPEEFSKDFPKRVNAFPVFSPSSLFHNGTVYINTENKVDEILLRRIKSAYKKNEYVGLFYVEEDYHDLELVKKVGDLSQIGTLGYVDDVSKHFGSTYSVSITPVGHAIEIQEPNFVRFHDAKICITPYVAYLEDETDIETLKAYSLELQEIMQEIFEDLDSFINYQTNVYEELGNLKDTDLLYHERLIDYCCVTVIQGRQEPKFYQEILEENNLLKKMFMVIEQSKQELETMKIRRHIQSELDEKFNAEQRRYYLQEQYKLIGKELGYSTNEKEVLREKFESMLSGKKIPGDVMEVIREEFRKLNTLDAQNAEFNVVRTYLEWLCSLPWGVMKEENFDLEIAEEELNKHHYGLSDVKERILEFIAVSIIHHRNEVRKNIEKDEEKEMAKLMDKSLLTALAEDFEFDEVEEYEIIEEEEDVKEEKRLCNYCKSENKNLKRCSVCKSVYYCNTTCQKKDWERHKKECVKISKNNSKNSILEEYEEDMEEEIEDEEKSISRGKILCFVGPPGTGKTSIGQSIAKAVSRDFYRFSVGGMNDVSEIKGHRRTYIGAMPGKLVQVLKISQSQNPVILIDEIDKMGQAGFRGDPSSALLEVLDPEQNSGFMDHYLDVPLDLSKVLFICTANNTQTIPRPLLDRMEVIRLSGYVTEEKIEIAKQHLIPRLVDELGLTDVLGEGGVLFSDEVLRQLITGYCREAGVRSVEKKLEKLLRKVAYQHVKEEINSFKIETNDDLFGYLGKPRFSETSDNYYGEDLPVGTTIGLAWTELGGSILYIETLMENLEIKGNEEKDEKKPTMRRIGDIVVTGMLGEVMQESITLAYTFARNFLEEKFNSNFFDGKRIHLHVPEGAIPKDGPSAGITIVTSLLSLALGKQGNHLFGMTGEITLKGKVLPIGGVKEKIIAAKRAGLEKIILPKENRRDLDELEDYLKKDLEFFFVDYYDDAFDIIFGEK